MIGNLVNFLPTALPLIGGFLDDRRNVRDRNRERLKQHARNEANYRNKFNRDVVSWRNASNDRDIEVDEKWQQVHSQIASDDLKLWSGIAKAGIATQQAYATMMSVGASEQTGARSATTTNRRKAVLQYAATMANVANKLSLSRDNAALNRDTWGNEFTRFAQASHVKTISGRPSPGTPPPSIPLENEPDFLTGLVLPLAGDFINFRKGQKELEPKFTDDQMTPQNPDAGTATDGKWTPQSSSGMSLFGDSQSVWGQPPGQKEQIGDFFIKRDRNIASSRLGSSFLTTAT